jgi:ABC-2 type transport system ATP-binding protein
VRYGPPGTPPAVDDLHLAAEPGEVLVLLGPNGAGKTSTVETLEGYRRPVAGHVRVLGLDPAVDHARLTGRVGVMLQRGGVYPMLGPRRVLDLFAAYYADPVPTDELLDLVGLRAVAGTPWRHLSGGEQQRLSLGLALIGRPEVAFLDEPTAGVDPEGRIAIRRAVADMKEGGVCILLTTHELGEAEKLADRIAIMSHGRLARAGAPRQLLAGGPDTAPGDPDAAGSGPSATAVVTFGGPPGIDAAALAGAVGPDTSVVESTPGRYRVDAGPGIAAPAVTAAVATFLADRGATLTDLAVGKSLEEIYFETVGVSTGREDEPPAGGPVPPGTRARVGRSRPGRRARRGSAR